MTAKGLSNYVKMIPTRSIPQQMLEIARHIVDALAEKKGEKIVLLDIQELASFADYFIICSGTSDRMLNALADAVVDSAKRQHGLKARIEGKPDFGWIVVDCGDIIVHLFSPSQRDYYSLEKLWDKGKTILRLQ